MTNTPEPSAVRELIANAYHAGAMAVHKDWMEREPSGALLDNYPEFGEAAGDYANSIDLAALSASPAPSQSGLVEQDMIDAFQEAVAEGDETIAIDGDAGPWLTSEGARIAAETAINFRHTNDQTAPERSTTKVNDALYEPGGISETAPDGLVGELGADKAELVRAVNMSEAMDVRRFELHVAGQLSAPLIRFRAGSDREDSAIEIAEIVDDEWDTILSALTARDNTALREAVNVLTDLYDSICSNRVMQPDMTLQQFGENHCFKKAVNLDFDAIDQALAGDA